MKTNQIFNGEGMSTTDENMGLKSFNSFEIERPEMVKGGGPVNDGGVGIIDVLD
ncbi:MAG: hypothetical protein ACPGVB_16900 [Chitinophagales bacterium]